MMSQKILLSVVIIAKNEEENIEGCLASVADWADEVIVVDDESTDRTAEIARRYTDKVFSKKMVLEGEHRNWAYALAKNLWILSLDADEKVSEELKKEIQSHLMKETDISIFSIPIKTYVGNHWLKYAGWYPASKLRLFKKGSLRFAEEEVHPKVFYEGKVFYLKSDIIHRAYKDFEDLIRSFNKQSTLEAKKWIRTNRKMSSFHAFWRALERFLKRYFLQKGYRDGLYGFMAAYIYSFYQITSYVKYREMHRKSSTTEKS